VVPRRNLKRSSRNLLAHQQYNLPRGQSDVEKDTVIPPRESTPDFDKHLYDLPNRLISILEINLDLRTDQLICQSEDLGMRVFLQAGCPN